MIEERTLRQDHHSYCDAAFEQLAIEAGALASVVEVESEYVPEAADGSIYGGVMLPGFFFYFGAWFRGDVWVPQRDHPSARPGAAVFFFLPYMFKSS